MDKYDNYYKFGCLGLIGLGAIVIVCSICGIIGSLKKNKCCLTIYSIGVIVLLVIFGAVAVAIIVVF